MTKEEVVSLMLSSTDENTWSENCDIVKKAHDGGYPQYWFDTIIVSGLLKRVSRKWLT